LSKLEKVLGNAALKIFKGFVIEKDINSLEIDHASIKKILFVIRHQMGDMIAALPMMRSVRSFYPDSQIILVTKKSTRFEEIFKDNNSPVNEVKYYETGIENFLKLAKELKDESIDLAIVPSSVVFSATNHLLAYYSRAKYRAGVRSKDYEVNKTGYVLNIKNDFLWDSKKVHQVERNLDVIRQLSINISDNTIRITLNDENQKFADNFIKEHFPELTKPVIGFHPGAGKLQNVWPAEKFAETARMFYQKTGAFIFISEGPSDEIYVSEMEKYLKEKNITQYIRHKGTLMNNTAIISKLNLFISNDTGVMHLAAGLDVPLIGLFGLTNAYEWGPVGENKVSIQAFRQNLNNIEPREVFETGMTLLNV